ncbi:transmembrane protein 169-like [Lingula anatina]|uniref:Transmembrane protein 169 n=1 Tax=Lingula anatina TaxID=7574 RepID=A0A1S3K8E1_LINAN|nr:transmembrane protein 169 [Lingula anatina]XP_013418893.1 transmembrane protein 169-like [Lingula anatina]|eukprot:XP_013413871.1 transmembrane protein 169 [Lingula anatina]
MPQLDHAHNGIEQSSSQETSTSLHQAAIETLDQDHHHDHSGTEPQSDIDESVSVREKLTPPSEQKVTVTGTIKRGPKAGQSVEVELRLSKDELQKLGHEDEESVYGPGECTLCGLKKGIHVFLFTVIVTPFAFFGSLGLSFYLGAQTWYNIFIYFSEERTIWHKVFLCPLLILTFPLTVGLSALGIALYAALIQISWWFKSWLKEMRDLEKGFFGWFCAKVDLMECSPYEVVVLDDIPAITSELPGTSV